jgi:hypothetical protein
MSDPTINGLRRMNNKLDESMSGIRDFMDRQMNGEEPDSEEFAHLVEKQGVAKDALQAQFKLYEKPMKTVLNETK